ncbi:MAG: UvrD-helicase domain-containing protein, partial [Pseudomonas sp.]
MSDTDRPREVEQAVQMLHSLLRQGAYIARKQAGDHLLVAGRGLPGTIRQRLWVYAHPARGLGAIRLRRFLKHYEAERQAHNKRFVDKEIVRHGALFDTVNGYPLVEQQRRAVVADEDNSLVIAGAGSGKTLTIVGKVKYLLEALGVAPEAILPISFTAKSAASLRERIGVDAIRPQTFHAFGLSVLRTVEGKQPAMHDDTGNDALLRSFVDKLSANHQYKQLLDDFLGNYLDCTRAPRKRTGSSSGQASKPLDDSTAFVSLSRAFLALLKSNGQTVAHVRALNRRSKSSAFLKQRTDLFLTLFSP